ncbi:transglycosylase domain-containing protein [Georgenia sp. TF02-10]|uniref:transglycosylase domain-containing protein n=1 Tax=Georgenia sp. TF02-10 TaxID=2917725 RepID=UPI001FA6C9C4|nr:transglycosylase domain-containing protein [Georgenia sp. TF02-10]UNX55231.1 transglycosylase domain-containing protein [Georgenia sp. TF02-10]
MSSPPPPSGRAVKPAQLVTMLLAFVLVAGIGGLLGTGLVMPAVGAVGRVTQASTDLFEDLPSELAIPEPSQQSVILDATGGVMARIYADNRVVVGLDQISPHLQHAVVAIEDRRFYEHKGVDPEGIMRAAVNNATGGELEGASTLTQQYVKNVLIDAGRVAGDEEAVDAATERSVGRKLEEARLAIGLEQQVSKEDILAGYLNIAPFGPSQYGVEAAAQHYFSKSAKDLTISEAALLAGITQSPGKHDPVRNPDSAVERRNVVLGAMRDQGYITQAEYDEAVAVPLEAMLNVSNTPNGCAQAGTAAYFCEYVVKDLLRNEAWGKDAEDRQRMLYRGGLVIQTTLDPAKQQMAYESVTANVPANDPSGVDMALSSVEPGTGYIRAMAQNTNYGEPTDADPGATTLNFNVGTSHGGGIGFQSGSTFKVFTLVEWLETGHSLNEQVVSNKRNYPRRSWNIPCNPTMASDYNPKNLEGVGGPRMRVVEATRQSVNLSFVQMANQMDLCAIMDNAATMGVQRGEAGAELEPYPSAVLGANNVTPLSMARAFATLAAGGVSCEPVAITGITDRAGNEIPAPKSACTQVLEPSVVNGVNYALQQVVTPQRGSTGSRAVLPDRPAAGKTGTANDDSAAWFVGYTPQLASAVWMGHSTALTPMLGATINGKYNKYVYGGSYPAQTWHDYMVRALEGAPVVPFAAPPPDQLTAARGRVTVPNVLGTAVADAEAQLTAAGLDVEVGPPAASDVPTGAVAQMNPGAGAQVRPRSTVTLTPSAGPAGTATQAAPDQGDGESDGESDGAAAAAAGAPDGGDADGAGPAEEED